MSVTSPAGPAPSPGEGPERAQEPCTACGARLEPDQEWCLECGAARTIIHRPPDWRIPVAAVGLVVLAAAVAFVIALTNLGAAGTPATVGRVAASGRTDQSAATQPRSRALASWPPGLSGWTVELAVSPIRAPALGLAQRLAAAGLAGVGVLETSQHPLLKPGDYVVFVGHLPDQAAAAAAVKRLSAQGHPGGVALEVAAPGGI
jgi:hypothetical protein